jgi:hypothetical protein
MYQLVFFKLRNTYNLCGRSYMLFLIERPFHFITAFLIITLMLSFGLFQIRMNMDPESLTLVRGRESLRHVEIINRTFPFDQHKRHFINKLLDFGYYVEIIVSARSPDGKPRPTNEHLLLPEYNLLNQTLLDEFNLLYDTIVKLEIEEYGHEPAALLSEAEDSEKTEEETASTVSI